MRLLQSEINVVPGNRPNRAPRMEGWVGDGTAVLSITNTSPLVNAYTIRVECDHPYWRRNWVQLAALPPDGLAENNPPPGKPDLAGPKNESLKIHISTRGTRQIQLQFTLPRNSTARAGAYPLRVVIVAEVSDAVANGNQPRVTELPAVMIVRPFHEGTVEFEPVNRVAKFWRRSAWYRLKVTNKGNDWLYVDIRPQKATDVVAEVAVSKLSIPPPEPDQEMSRSVVIKATSLIRPIRSELKHMPVPISVTRADAPSIPALPEDSAIGGPANLWANVLAEETRDQLSPTEPATLIYSSPIPAKLVDFFTGLKKNLVGLVMAAVGLFFVGMLTMTIYEREFRKLEGVNVNPSNGKLANDGTVTVTGTWLKGAELTLKFKSAKGEDEVTVAPKKFDQVAGRSSIKVTDNVYSTAIPLPEAGIKDATITKITIRRRMPVLGTWLMPLKEVRTEILVGRASAGQTVEAAVMKKDLRPGDPLLIRVKTGDMGTERSLKLGDRSLSATYSDDTKELRAKVPDDFEPGGYEALLVVDGESVWSSPITIVKVEDGVEVLPPDGSGQSGAGGEPVEIVGADPAPSGGSGQDAPVNPSAQGGGERAQAPRGPVEGYSVLVEALTTRNSRTIAESASAVTGQDPRSAALRAYALAWTDADAAEAELGAKPGGGLPLGYYLAAQARIAQTRGDERQAKRLFGQATEAATGAFPRLASNPGTGALFPHLARAAYLFARQPEQAQRVLAEVPEALLTDGEKQAKGSLR